mmetsp:Transcript_13146/g.28537  ORF Transcript_13146/g.28537 Transcript_13146/m.28537 type:complete len:122 (+) Transcript_13146:800-1165(+)
MAEYTRQVQDGTDVAHGWPDWMNVPSKVFQVASMRVLAKEWKERGQKSFVAAVCPGLVQTEASRPFFDPEAFAKAPTPNQAAEPIVDLALREDHSTTGELYGQLIHAPTSKVIPWTNDERD